MFLPLIAVFSLMQEPNALPDAVQVQFQLPAERIVEYPASELRQISAPVLSETAQEAFDNSFLVTSHYSAFAYSTDIPQVACCLARRSPESDRRTSVFRPARQL